MKRFVSVLITVFIGLSLLIGCSLLSLLPEPIPVNQVSPIELSFEQYDVINMLSNNNEFAFFKFETDDAFSEIEFWIEVYQKGTLIRKPSAVYAYNDEPAPFNGKISMQALNNRGMQWTLSMSFDGGGEINQTSDRLRMDDLVVGYVSGQIEEPVTIEDGKEIVLYATNHVLDPYAESIEDFQAYVTEPEIMEEFPYVHILKCKFTK